MHGLEYGKQFKTVSVGELVNGHNVKLVYFLGSARFIFVFLAEGHFDLIGVCPAVIAANVFVENLPSSIHISATSKGAVVSAEAVKDNSKLICARGEVFGQFAHGGGGGVRLSHVSKLADFSEKARKKIFYF